MARNPQNFDELEEARKAQYATNIPGFEPQRQEGAPHTPGMYQVETAPRVDPNTGNVVKQYHEASPSMFADHPANRRMPGVGYHTPELASNDSKALSETQGRGLLDRTPFLDDIGAAPSNRDLIYGRREYIHGAKIAGKPRHLPLNETVRGNMARDRVMEHRKMNAPPSNVQVNQVDQANQVNQANQANQVRPVNQDMAPKVPYPDAPKSGGTDAASRLHRNFGSLGVQGDSGPLGEPGVPGPTGEPGVPGPTGSRMFTATPDAGMEDYKVQLSNHLINLFGPDSALTDAKTADMATGYPEGSEQGFIPGVGYGTAGNALFGAGAVRRFMDQKQLASITKGVEKAWEFQTVKKFSEARKIPLSDLYSDNPAMKSHLRGQGFDLDNVKGDAPKKELKKEAKAIQKAARKEAKVMGKLIGGGGRILSKAAGPVGWAALGIELGNEFENRKLKDLNEKLIKSDYAPMVVADLVNAAVEIKDADTPDVVWQDAFNQRAQEIIISWNDLVGQQLDNPGLENDPTSKKGRELFSVRSKASPLWKGAKITDNMKWAMSSTISAKTDTRLLQRREDFRKYREAGTFKRGFNEPRPVVDTSGRYEQWYTNPEVYTPSSGYPLGMGANYLPGEETRGAPSLGMSFKQFQAHAQAHAKEQGYDLPKHDLQNYWAAGQQQMIDDMRKRKIINFSE